MSDCNEAPSESKYCYERTQPTSKCKCSKPTNYKKNARDQNKFKKGKYEYKQRGRSENSTAFWYYNMPFGAHHVIPVAAAKILGTHTNQVVKDSIMLVQWCVNSKPNMLALPLWGHTIKHYCNLAMGSAITQTDLLSQTDTAPTFADLPMHDVDHDKFTAVAENKVSSIADEVSQSAEDHKVNAASILSELKDLSESLDEDLHDYGKREGGTHKAWKTGVDDEEDTSKWYMAFSMADDGEVRPRTFPCRSSGKAWERIQNLAKAFVAGA